jgi:hypothetical protein
MCLIHFHSCPNISEGKIMCLIHSIVVPIFQRERLCVLFTSIVVPIFQREILPVLFVRLYALDRTSFRMKAMSLFCLSDHQIYLPESLSTPVCTVHYEAIFLSSHRVKVSSVVRGRRDGWTKQLIVITYHIHIHTVRNEKFCLTNK